MAETKIDECESCQFDGVELHEVGDYTKEQVQTNERLWPYRKRWICSVCAGNYISVATRYNKPNVELYATLGYLTNLILKAIKESRS